MYTYIHAYMHTYIQDSDRRNAAASSSKAFLSFLRAKNNNPQIKTIPTKIDQIRSPPKCCMSNKPPRGGYSGAWNTEPPGHGIQKPGMLIREQFLRRAAHDNRGTEIWGTEIWGTEVPGGECGYTDFDRSHLTSHDILQILSRQREVRGMPVVCIACVCVCACACVCVCVF